MECRAVIKRAQRFPLFPFVISCFAVKCTEMDKCGDKSCAPPPIDVPTMENTFYFGLHWHLFLFTLYLKFCAVFGHIMASCSINCVFSIRVFPEIFSIPSGPVWQQHVSGDMALEWHDCNAIICPFIYSYSILQRRICRMLLQKSNMLEFIFHFIFDADAAAAFAMNTTHQDGRRMYPHPNLCSQQSHASDFLVLSC